jgi:hypothetical protein
MSKSEDFLRHAEDCLRRAHRSADEDDQRAWLRMAETWLRLVGFGAADAAKLTAAEEFEALTSARGTGQKASSESH